MIWVVVAAWTALLVALVWFTVDEWRWRRRIRAEDEAIALTKERHPSRRTAGPEDEPGWAEWKESH